MFFDDPHEHSDDAPAPTSSSQLSTARNGFDPEPVQTLPPDEPRTPLWLPVLGLVVVLLGGLLLLLASDENETGPSAAGAIEPEASSPARSAAADATAAPTRATDQAPQRPTGAPGDKGREKRSPKPRPAPPAAPPGQCGG